MRNQVIVEYLDEALAGEGGAVNLGRVVGTEEGVGGLAYDAVDRFDGQFFQIQVGCAGGGAKGNQDVGDDGVGARPADERGRCAFGFPTDVRVPEVVGEGN